MSWIVLGCGYTGARLAARLRADDRAVAITRRTPFTAEGPLAGARTYAVDLGDRATVAALPTGGATVVVLAPPGDDPDGEARTLARACRDAHRIVYVSSTGVYGPGYGAWVDERWPLAPMTASGRARVAMEQALAAAATVPVVVLRPAGIYGPDRGVHARIAAGTYRIVGDGAAHVSRIHVDDLVSAIVAAGTHPTIAGAINVADDAPDPIGEVADAIAAHLGVPPPPRVPAAQVDREVAGMLLADRRIANRRLREELGVTLVYPSWRTGL